MKNKPGGADLLATVLEARMFALVAVLVVIVANLLRNDFHFEFSCHVFIIARLVIE